MTKTNHTTSYFGWRGATAGVVALLMAACAGRTTVTEKMMWSTCPVATLHGEASGFIIMSRDPTGEDVAVILTCAHVLKTMKGGPLIVGLHHQTKDGDVVAEPLIIIPARESLKMPFYVSHPVHDLAAFRITLPKAARKLVNLETSVDERTLDTMVLHAGDEVSFLGYPDVFPGTKGAFALLRSGRIASHPASGPMARGRFFINADVYPGDSGAPVFLTARTGRPRVVGILTSRIGPDTRSFSHLALAVDVKAIRETLSLLRQIPSMPVDLLAAPAVPR